MEGTVPLQPTAAAQLDLAGAISANIPFDPDLTVVAYAKVLEIFSGDAPPRGRSSRCHGRHPPPYGSVGGSGIGLPQGSATIFPRCKPLATLARIRQQAAETRQEIQANR